MKEVSKRSFQVLLSGPMVRLMVLTRTGDRTREGEIGRKWRSTGAEL